MFCVATVLKIGVCEAGPFYMQGHLIFG